MKDKDYFDNVLKSVIDDSDFNIETSRDIFNEAWNKREKEMSKRKYFNIQNMKKIVLVPTCCVALVLGGVFTFSPGARAAAQEVLKTIFYPDKSGNIVEKSEDTEIPVYGPSIPVTDENKSDIERRFGFKINLPEKIGEYTYLKEDDEVGMPYARIKVDNVKYKDMDSIVNKLIKALHEDKAFNQLSKEYKLTGCADSKYMNEQGHQLVLTLMKENEDSKNYNEDIEQEITINDITCKVTKVMQPKYNMKEIEKGVTRTNMESKPVDTITNYILSWKYDGVEYYISIGKDLSNIDVVKQFATEYIKTLKEK
ncbi:hypothetical protein psyc5s11_03440 [Clostridium gelidum]|uniref:DUF4367 domain-containing protein n=1 Tax=Clostridium gelidum TaxID=704125 RepID=A0ABM7T0A4_9CLOT|nr:hypothetical protein [Clostridium gelidum]BCZ44277.1 hypothetical protein psyc5s11_03440 [Clostridium gelidum]